MSRSTLRAAHHVDQIGDLLKREERNAERQDDVDEARQGRAREPLDRIEKEVGIFEIAEHREIERDGGDADRAAARRILHQQAER